MQTPIFCRSIYTRGDVMSTIERTAYPRYSNRRRMKPSELDEFYTLSSSEVSLMSRYARGDKYRLNFAIQLKTFQNLGYFIAFDEVVRLAWSVSSGWNPRHDLGNRNV